MLIAIPPDKAKPVARWGRKAAGSSSGDPAARLPKSLLRWSGAWIVLCPEGIWEGGQCRDEDQEPRY